MSKLYNYPMDFKFEINKDTSVQKIVKIMLLERRMTIAELARRMGKLGNVNYNRQNLSQKLICNSLKFSKMILICEILHFKIDIFTV